MFSLNSQTQTDTFKWSALFFLTGTVAYTGYKYIHHLNKTIAAQNEAINSLKENNQTLSTKLRKTHEGKERVVHNLRIEKIIKNLFKLGTRHLENENFALRLQIEGLGAELEIKNTLLNSAENKIELLSNRTLELQRQKSTILFPSNSPKMTPTVAPPRYSKQNLPSSSKETNFSFTGVPLNLPGRSSGSVIASKVFPQFVKQIRK